MYTILVMNQKGGVGKTTIADELAFALERRGESVAFVSTDPQGGAVHDACLDPDVAEGCDWQVVDTAGCLVDEMQDWCRAADVILVPILPSVRDIEPTMRTLDVIGRAQARDRARVVVNEFWAFGRLDRQLVEFLDSESVPVIAKVPRTVAFAQAAGEGRSLADYDCRNRAVMAIESLADAVVEMVRGNGDV